MEERRADAIRLAKDFLPGEMREFRYQVHELGELLRRVATEDWDEADMIALGWLDESGKVVKS
jgi:hypothetical protein